MSAVEPLIILTVLFGIGAVVYLSNKIEPKKENFVGFTGKHNLWFVIDDYGVNSRRWADFGARTSKDSNIGFLNITKTRCHITQGEDFNVIELLGRQAVAQVIREHNGFVPEYHLEIPQYLWRAWARSALLAYAGGLYLDGFSLCLGPSFATVINNSDNLLFGLDKDPLSSSPYAGWASNKGSIPWLLYVDAVSKFIEKGPLSWDSGKARNQIANWNMSILAPSVRVLVEPEWSRLSDGTTIELEDIFGRSISEYYNPLAKSIYMPVDNEKLQRAVSYNWFLRMSSEQILDPESHFIWAQLAQKTAARDKLTLA